MRTLPPLKSLRAFEATARLQGVQKASEELHVTHGAVSRQLKQ
ncbi:MAG: LysR family transcriptional regulator, partial [Oceanospirillaceae bacterium]|nr:LysR family transcriptional regulator [Oceanospirillaceae bacterium]